MRILTSDHPAPISSLYPIYLSKASLLITGHFLPGLKLSLQFRPDREKMLTYQSLWHHQGVHSLLQGDALCGPLLGTCAFREVEKQVLPCGDQGGDFRNKNKNETALVAALQFIFQSTFSLCPTFWNDASSWMISPVF